MTSDEVLNLARDAARDALGAQTLRERAVA
jgi:hypothetical protein